MSQANQWKFVAATGLGGVALICLVIAACRGELSARKQSAVDGLPETVSYNSDVRPILAQNCLFCHGRDAKRRQADLRLDQSDSAYASLKDDPKRHAIVPGNPKKSELFARITTQDPDLRMPPLDAHKTLSARDVGILKRWIEQGAKYEKHWAYAPVTEFAPPPTPWDSQASNPIDRYVFAKLAEHGLKPSSEADRETLINRVTLALTGLPPTLAEVDTFLADHRPDAYGRLVDRLLQSPAHAEQMTSVWMDVAGFADTNGYLFDNLSATQYPYRDWVISAYQRNMPYDQFVTWQLAGDLLAHPTREQILATAFTRVGKKNNEAGITDEEFRVEYMDTRTELVGKAFLGLTVACAKCHDHKYDEISQAEYYSLGGFFNQVDEGGHHNYDTRGMPMGPNLPWPTAEQVGALTAAHQVVEAREGERAADFDAARRARSTSPPANANLVIAHDLARVQQAYFPLERLDRKGPSFEELVLKPKHHKPFHSSAPSAPNLMESSVDPNRRALDDLDLAASNAESKLPPPPKPQPDLGFGGFQQDKMVWSASGVPGAAPLFISNAHSIDGPPGKGNALLLNNTVVICPPGVGVFERTQPFSLDLWVKIPPTTVADEGEGYENRNDIVHRGFTGATVGPGYHLSMVPGGRLSFRLTHQPPFNALELWTKEPVPVERWIHLTATYDGSSRAAGAKLYMNGIALATEVRHDYLSRSIKPEFSPGGQYDGVQLGLVQGAPEFKGGIDELRIFTKALPPLEVAYLHDPKSLLAAPAVQLQEQLAAIEAEADPRVVDADKRLREAREAEEKVETPIVQLMVLKDRVIARPTYLLQQGVYSKHGQEVPIQALQAVLPYDRVHLPPNRLGLAKWLFDPRNPLTARVYVNRLWQSLFGIGIVETVDDFGTQGANPTNLALLDYLAAEFVRSGWDIRHLQKLIVTSATYRQSSTVSAEALKSDPRNLYLARGPRFRMTGEMIRDSALAASGLLVQHIGGDSVFPYQPEGIWPGRDMGDRQFWPEAEDVPADQHHRRSLYTFIKRNAPFPSLTMFDFPDRGVAAVRRNISSTPLQALVLLNDVQYREADRKIAEEAIKSSTDADLQLTYVFRVLLRREPTPNEFAAMKTLRTSRLVRYTSSMPAAVKLVHMGVAPVDTSIDPVQAAALSEVALVVMNSPDAASIR